MPENERTVRQYVITLKSTIMPDNGDGDEYARRTFDKACEIDYSNRRFVGPITFPVGYFIEMRPA